ncbi:4-hydroxybenzoate octaprenyltransferase [Pelagibius sp. Alg239-R121]|uniref:4-hydroxybenzoate octaprenyltransferase n=1 Tax=Pelagibius sp. Alg239-R121 TaxID=2993448 RepID=UPI0024A768AD|nr:4-hydroxybenzoate octaprenyltransferase [Pelagibius sp. Alg239-R121]
MNDTTIKSDIVRSHWTLRLTPKSVWPYIKLARLDRPIGVWLLLFPCWWSLAMAVSVPGTDLPYGTFLWLLLLFGAGALVMRGAGCTFNDIVDRDFDIKVARTSDRPIPSGQVTTRQAIAFLGLQLFIGLIILLQFNFYAVAVGVASLLLVFTYPFMKRITYWPQAWLGLTFNWGALVGWAVVQAGLDWPALILYAAGIAWTLGYDTIYAHQDKEDDALIGVKSTALKFGNATKPWLWLFYALTSLMLAAAGTSLELPWPYWLALAAVSAHFCWQIVTLDMDDPHDCLSKFKSNRQVGWILFVGLLVSNGI